MPAGLTGTLVSNAHQIALSTMPLSAFQSWQLARFGSLTNPKGAAGEDWDGDGMSNFNEFLAGTDPTNKASVFRIDAMGRSGGGSNMVLSFTTVSGKSYQLEWTTNLTSGVWTNEAAMITGTGNPMPMTNSQPAVTPRFYRMSVGP